MCFGTLGVTGFLLVPLFQHFQLIKLCPVVRRVDPLRLGGKRHLHAVPELSGDECRVHASHQAQCCVRVARVLHPAASANAQLTQRGQPVTFVTRLGAG